MRKPFVTRKLLYLKGEINYEKYQVSFMNEIFKNHENTALDNIYLLKVPKETDIIRITEDYISQPFVEFAEPNFLIQLFSLPKLGFLNLIRRFLRLLSEKWE